MLYVVERWMLLFLGRFMFILSVELRKVFLARVIVSNLFIWYGSEIGECIVEYELTEESDTDILSGMLLVLWLVVDWLVHVLLFKSQLILFLCGVIFLL